MGKPKSVFQSFENKQQDDLSSELDNYFDNCNDNYQCVFEELMGEYNDKPDFRRKIDDRWTPDVNEDYFNEILNDYLGDVRL